MASNFTGTAAGSEIPKSVISIAVLAGALIIGLIIAKCVNVFYDRQSIRDDASDISDYTRERLKEQLALVFNKGIVKKKRRPEELTRKYYTIWRNNVKRNRGRRERGEEVNPGRRPPGGIKGEASDPPASVSTENEVKAPTINIPQDQTPTSSASSSSSTALKPKSLPPIVTVTSPAAGPGTEPTPAPGPVSVLLPGPDLKITVAPVAKEAHAVVTPATKGAPTATTQKGPQPPFATLYAAPVTDARRRSASGLGKNGPALAEKRDSIVSRSAGSVKGREDKKPPSRPKSGFKAATVQPVTPKKAETTPRPGTAKKK